ncbi:LPS assembly protein LptD [Photobacterium jeanii]|uniref:LPS-assembly protein LptD n=1 Tax=Photobacterium jeanii TaxID=858640 RepID=A0A178KPZ2_9GAMM|nr:LPS assembly protein LptD [Photobacterium jeanii]OAN19005.1 LPS assembly protein LptD [Photobacterium jeanii]PST87667.1 LPS assembly protein LptD [Photobacterium jeanii]
MSLSSRSLLATMISLALYGPAMADDNPQATTNNINDTTNEASQESQPEIDVSTLEVVKGTCIAPQDRSQDINNEPVHIAANEANAESAIAVTYSGDVVIKQGHRTMAADTATYHQPDNSVTAEGNVYFHDGGMEVFSDRLESDLDTEDSEMDNAVYNMTCEPGRGEAEKVVKDGLEYYRLKNGTYTTCPAGDQSWRFSATSIERETDSPFANLYNARFEVVDVPIFYLPYLRVPVGKERLTGFLYPNIKLNSRDGFSVMTPFYWNIAPNYDMTITPKYMTNRGLQLNTDFRYLTTFGSGGLKAEYLGSDQKYQDLGARWAFNFNHSGTYQGHWLFTADYSKVSDVAYFNDITSNIGKREDNNLLQTAEASYREQDWDATLRVRDFQPLTTGVSSNYRLMPQLEANYYRLDLPYGFDFQLNGHLSRFEIDDPNKPSADRLHLEPTLTLPYSTPWWSITSEAKLMYTYYNQEFDKNVQANQHLEETVSRTIPSIRVHSGLYLERNTQIWGSDYTQSLEPQVQYLYVQSVDQKNIYDAYDTTLLQTDYYGLFRDKRYSSVDRIAAANQFTVGASTRYFDNEYKERFNLSIGQIFYLNQDNANIDDSSDEATPNYSATALESDFNYDDWLFFHGGLQFDAGSNDIQFANSALEYRESSFFTQLNYRFVSKDYIKSSLKDNNDIDKYTDKGISQAGIVTGFPVYGGLSVRGDYYHDLNDSRMIESQISLNYRTSCWLITVGYNKYLVARGDVRFDTPTYENNYSISFSLLGLAGVSSFGASTASGNAIAYGQPFNLNN